MRAKKPKLVVYVVEHDKKIGSWVLRHDGALVGVLYPWVNTKASAISEAASRLGVFASLGQPSELRIRNKNGTFAPARTYPRSSDPKKSRG